MPEPAKGWRAFAGEVGTIVLGVLIALVCQQIADGVNSRRDAADALAAVHDEIGSNLGQLGNRVRIAPCILVRLDQIAAVLDDAEAGLPFRPVGWVGRPQVWNMDSYRWQSASQGGRASLLSTEQQARYADLYGTMSAIGEAQDREQIAWAELRVLEGRTRLSETAIAQLRSAMSQARLADWRIRHAYRRTTEATRNLGIPLTADATNRGSDSVCLPITTDRPTALRRLGVGATGEP